jgi:hypothetical protein
MAPASNSTGDRFLTRLQIVHGLADGGGAIVPRDGHAFVLTGQSPTRSEEGGSHLSNGQRSAWLEA